MKSTGIRFSLRVVIVTLFLVSSVVFFPGCRIFKRDKQKIAEKKQAEAEKKATAEYEKARKQHYNNQSKQAKKMMKQTRKQADKYNEPKKRKSLFKESCD